MRRMIRAHGPRSARSSFARLASTTPRSDVPFGLTPRLKRNLPPQIVMHLVMPQSQGLINRPTWQRSEAAQQQRAFADSRESPREILVLQNVLQGFAAVAESSPAADTASAPSPATNTEGPDFGRPPGAALLGPLAASQYEVILARHNDLRSFLQGATDLFLELFRNGLPIAQHELSSAEDEEALGQLLHSHIVDTLKNQRHQQGEGKVEGPKVEIKQVLGARIVDSFSVWDGTARESDLEDADAVEADERGHSISLASAQPGGIIAKMAQRFAHFQGLQPPRRVVSQVTVAFVCEEEHGGQSVGVEMEWPPAQPLETQESRPLRSAFSDGLSNSNSKSSDNMSSSDLGSIFARSSSKPLTRAELEEQQRRVEEQARRIIGDVLKSNGLIMKEGSSEGKGEVKVGVGGMAGPFVGVKTFSFSSSDKGETKPESDGGGAKKGKEASSTTSTDADADELPPLPPSDDKPLSPPSIFGSGPGQGGPHRRSAGSKNGVNAEAFMSGHRTAFAIMSRLLGERFTSMLPASVCAQLKLPSMHACGPEAHDLRRVELVKTPASAAAVSAAAAAAPGVQFQSLEAPWDRAKPSAEGTSEEALKDELPPLLVVDGVATVGGDDENADAEGDDNANTALEKPQESEKAKPKEKKRVTVHTLTFEGSLVNERLTSSFSGPLIEKFPLARYFFPAKLAVEQPWRIVDIDGHFSETSSGKKLSWTAPFEPLTSSSDDEEGSSSSALAASPQLVVLTDSELLAKAKDLAFASKRWESELSFSGIQDHVSGIRPFAREAEAVARTLLQLHAALAKHAPNAVSRAKESEKQEVDLFYRAASRSGSKGLAMVLQTNRALLDKLWARPLSVSEAAEALCHVHATTEELLSLAPNPFWMRALKLEARIENAIEDSEGSTATASHAHAAADLKTTMGTTVSGVRLPKIFRPFAPGSAITGGRFLLQPHADKLELVRIAARLFPDAARHLSSLDASLSVEQPFQGQLRLASLDAIAVFGVPAAADSLLRLHRSLHTFAKGSADALKAKEGAVPAAEKIHDALSLLDKEFELTADDADADLQAERIISLQHVDPFHLMGSDDKKMSVTQERKELMGRIEKSARALQKALERLSAIEPVAGEGGQLLSKFESMDGGWAEGQSKPASSKDSGSDESALTAAAEESGPKSDKPAHKKRGSSSGRGMWKGRR